MAVEQCTKICKTCLQSKPEDAFYWHRPGQRMAQCKECYKAHYRERDKNKRIAAGTQAQYEAAKARQSLRADGMQVCTKCGAQKPLAAFSRSRKTKCGYREICKTCQAEAGKKYREANKAQIAEAGKVYRLANKALIVESHARYRAANKNKLKEAGKQYYQKKKDEILKKNRAWYAANVERHRQLMRQWASIPENAARVLQRARERHQENPEIARANWQKRRAMRRGAEGSYSPADVRRIHEMQRGKCAVCKKRLNGKYHADHIIPLASGGTNWPHNIQLLCPYCNVSKGAKDPIKFMQKRGFLL